MCVVVHSVQVARVKQKKKKMSVTVMKNDEEEQKKNIDEQYVDSLRMHIVQQSKSTIIGKCPSYILRLL
jgi:hypothetical protein